MRIGSGVWHYGDRPPGSTRRYHQGPTRTDAASHLRKAGRQRMSRNGTRCADVNVRAVRTLDGQELVIGSHWFTPWSNGFRYTTRVGAERRRLPRRVLKRPYDQWAWEELSQLRRRNGDRILTWAEIVDLGTEYGVIPCPELKDPLFGQLEWAQRITDECKRADMPHWAMALIFMAACKDKSAAQFAVGGFFAVILGKRWQRYARTVPPDWPWDPRPEVWNSHAKWWQRQGA